MSDGFKFALRQKVKISISGEAGEVIGRAPYSTTPLKSYYLRLMRGDGRASLEWWTEDALEADAQAELPPAGADC